MQPEPVENGKLTADEEEKNAFGNGNSRLEIFEEQMIPDDSEQRLRYAIERWIDWPHEDVAARFDYDPPALLKPRAMEDSN